MKLTEAIKSVEDRNDSSNDTFYLNGSITKDVGKGGFRLYPDPRNHRSYFVIQMNDVVGDLYEWLPEECAHAHFVGEQIFRVPLKAGAQIQSVEISIERIGETIAGQTSFLAPGGDTGVVGRCKSASGCGNKKCCTTKGTKCYCDDCCVAFDQFSQNSVRAA